MFSIHKKNNKLIKYLINKPELIQPKKKKKKTKLKYII